MVRWAERGAVSFVGSIAVSLLLASCGGRASSLQASGSGSDSGSAGSSQGGAAAVGGSASRGGATSNGGGAAGNGANSGAGALPGSDAGPPVCNDNCPEIDCPSGQMLHYLDMVCCPVCVACDASDQAACPPTNACGPAAHAEILPGSCCSQCVANDPAACMMQLESATDSAGAASQKYSVGCQADSDCAGALLTTTCAQTCIYAPKASLAAYLADLMQVEDCSACPSPNPIAPSCVTPVCSNQVCVDGTNFK